MDGDFGDAVQKFLDGNTALTKLLDASMSEQVDRSGADARGATVRIWVLTVSVPCSSSGSACSWPVWCPPR